MKGYEISKSFSLLPSSTDLDSSSDSGYRKSHLSDKPLSAFSGSPSRNNNDFYIPQKNQQRILNISEEEKEDKNDKKNEEEEIEEEKKDKHDLSNWEKHRIHLCPRSYQKEKLLPLKKDFICKKLYNYEINKFPNNKFTIDESVNNLAPYGKNLIRIFMNENDKREQKQRDDEEKLYIFKHSKPPLNLNPWKFSNHVIGEFSRPKADEIYGYREKKKVKYAYTVDPFRRPKEQGDLFDKHIGIL